MTFKRKSRDLNQYFNLRESLVRFLREDIGQGDLTSQYTVNKDLKSSSQIICKSEIAVVAGLEEAKIIFEICNCDSKALVNDGDIVKRGIRVMKINGNTRAILKAERTALNLIMRMSGIATDTKKFVDIVKTVSKDIKVMGTRKTAPGLRYFDKKSIILGGGHSHRNTLDELILIKDNHLAVTTSIQSAITNARLKAGKNMMIECEVSNTKSSIEAIKSGADIIMLDNFTPEMAQKTISYLRKSGLREKVLIEISGAVNISNIKDYALALPDMISIGSLTHSSNSIDFSMKNVA
ncbi:MAG: carboxylating nicotinate-nucleotide diphosphorylase [Nitrososphaeraceae archaeon]|nr:carboxylating nicotinate-nucleotide diphosphorylase [Nitrososphaeraceae archaeon]MDW0168277.1 carboxylating nicotinate-nucleotide diphosphorylase [Nitrososphaeraceae archaeon]MDW0173481.1 carboxylating nicotinate-nucleotide diphosphorylase [Nitrososphaeraceae archaeon]MDW0175483.1 carboxylating nicotinate-nucleotide diphosphorylase [Nitrososphaeraceae archaeon]MDW0180085.1 carboxylating nicotinate-nucleotide diphosphorylase [Nitrososphaeraceae archaeon]